MIDYAPDSTKVFWDDLEFKIKTEKLKIKYQKCRNMKNTERKKPSFTKRIGRKYEHVLTGTEQNNDHTWIMHKI